MKRIHEGLYTETKEVLVNGEPQTAEFQVFRVKLPDEKNPGKTIDSPFWAWACPKLKFMPKGPFEKKMDAMEDLEDCCQIGFKTMPSMSTTIVSMEPRKV